MSSQMMMLSALFLLVLQTNLLLSSSLWTDSTICLNNDGKYTVNSTYANNLNTAISSMYANIGTRGFYNASVGSQTPDIAHAIALCRGDVQPDVCRGCILDLYTKLQTYCPNQRQADGWEEYCMLRYSNHTIFGIMATQALWSSTSAKNATNPDKFMRDLSDHLDNLRERAANGGPLSKVAAGNVTANDSQEIYALVQCTPDLSSNDCTRCLSLRYKTYDATHILTYIDGRVFLTSCNLRYETYSFYNETRLRELDPLPPFPAPQPPIVPVPPSSAPQPPLAPVTPLPLSSGTNSRINTTRGLLLFLLLRSCFVCFCLLLV